MSEQRVEFLRKGLIGSCTLLALILLAAFYSIVHGAVDRAARQRVSAADGTTQGVVQSVQRTPAHRSALLAGVAN